MTAELIPASLLLRIGESLRVTPATVGTLVAAWALTIAVASLPLTRLLAARVGRRTLLPAVLLVLGLATLGTALAPTFGWALTSRVVAAAAHGLFWSLLVSTVAAMVPAGVMGRAVAVVQAGPVLAGIVGIPLGAFAGSHLGWRASIAALATLILLAAAVVRVLPLPRTVATPSSAGQGRSSLRPALVAAVAGGLTLTGHFALYTYVSPLLQTYGGHSPTAVAGLLFVFGIAGAAGIAAAGPLSDRYPESALRWVIVAFVVSAAMLTLVAAPVVVAIAVLALWGAMIGILPPAFQTHLLRVAPPDRRDAAGALTVTIFNIGIGAGSALGGLVASRGSVGALPWVAAAVIGVGVLVLARPADRTTDRVARFRRASLARSAREGASLGGDGGGRG